MKESLLQHLDRNSVINKSQLGFMARRSCFTNLLCFFEKLYESIDNGEALDTIYLDFRKAFDTVPHGRLLRQIKKCGVDGLLLSWLENWLLGRKQRVSVGGEYSDWSEVTSGVPQGSVLGPLLFLIFVSDIDEGITNKLLKFADDTKLVGDVSSPEGVESLYEDLELLYKWLQYWGMSFNVQSAR